MQNRIYNLVTNPISFKAYLFTKLPSAFFAGLRVKYLDDVQCVVSVPYKWFTKNPFKSTYFACLAMAAEMSTGVLALAAVHEKKPAISMLVVKLEATFHKKGKGKTFFTCADGERIQSAVEHAIKTGQGVPVTCTAVGVDENEETVAHFAITWSFKQKQPAGR